MVGVSGGNAYRFRGGLSATSSFMEWGVDRGAGARRKDQRRPDVRVYLFVLFGGAGRRVYMCWPFWAAQCFSAARKGQEFCFGGACGSTAEKGGGG